MSSVAPEVQVFLDFVEVNRHQGREERDARRCLMGFSPPTVSRMVRTVDDHGRVSRRTVADPEGIVEAWIEQVNRRAHGVSGSGGGGARVKRKRERVFPKPTVWPWEGC